MKYEQIVLAEVLGEGAFGKVYKGTLIDLPPTQEIKTFSAMFRSKPAATAGQSIGKSKMKRKCGERTVAVKMLHSKCIKVLHGLLFKLI